MREAQHSLASSPCLQLTISSTCHQLVPYIGFDSHSLLLSIPEFLSSFRSREASTFAHVLMCKMIQRCAHLTAFLFTRPTFYFVFNNAMEGYPLLQIISVLAPNAARCCQISSSLLNFQQPLPSNGPEPPGEPSCSLFSQPGLTEPSNIASFETEERALSCYTWFRSSFILL